MNSLIEEDFNRIFYISGPMTGYPEYNYPVFEEAATRLRRVGLKVRSPHEIPWPADMDKLNDEDLWRYMIAESLRLQKECNAIVLLQGWPESRGAWLEFEVARQQKHPVFYYLGNPGRLVRMSRRDNGDGEQIRQE